VFKFTFLLSPFAVFNVATKKLVAKSKSAFVVGSSTPQKRGGEIAF
jgi:hypothetical protein